MSKACREPTTKADCMRFAMWWTRGGDTTPRLAARADRQTADMASGSRVSADAASLPVLNPLRNDVVPVPFAELRAPVNGTRLETTS